MNPTKMMYRIIGYSLQRLHSEFAVPTALQLCLDYRCNLKCRYCMRETFKPEPVNYMSLENIKFLLKRMPYISTITIQGLCEPFLNPETPAILKYLKSEGYHLSFTTNGTIPLVGERLESLQDIDDFVISIDTSDQVTFEYLRQGAAFNDVIRNLYRVVQWKRANKLGKNDNPPIHINAVITTKNFNQIKELILMLSIYNDQIAYVMVDPVSRPDYSTFEDPLAMVHDDKFDVWLEDFRKFAKTSKLPVVGLDYMLEPSYNWKDCPNTMNMFLEPNGDMCECYGYTYIYGNVFKENPLFAFNNKKQRAFRKQLHSCNPLLQQCHSCNFAREGWQFHGGYITRARELSAPKPMTFYEAAKHVLKSLTNRRRVSF
jgi:radical SAM protein with 4Fe4S-binding SPASM domain